MRSWMVLAAVVLLLSPVESSTALESQRGYDGGPHAISRDTESVLTLRELGSYGWSELGDSTRGLTATERQFQGAMLGRIAGVAEGANGDVYVLDRSYHKVVVFSRDGSFKRLVTGGYGRGPGEFVQPRSIAVSTRGRVAVLDDAQSRIIIFAPDGAVEATVTVPDRLLLMSFSEERLLAISHPTQARPAVLHAVDVPSGRLHTLLELRDRDLALARGGGVGAFGRDRNGEVFYAMPSVGTWVALLEAGVGPRQGRPLYPSLAPQNVVREPVGPLTIVPIWLQTAGQLANGDRFLVYTVHRDSPQRLPRELGTAHMAAVLNKTGDLKHTLSLLPHDPPSGHFVMSAHADEILVGHADPYPRVTRYRIEVAPGQ